MKLISFEVLEKSLVKRKQSKALFRTPERGADEREKKTSEGTERTALEEGWRTRMPAIEEF